MFCTSCGKEIKEGSQNCENCGKEIKTREAINKNEKKPKENKMIKVAFHRTKKFTGCLVPMYIYIDNQKVLTLKNDQTIEIDVACGTHKVIVEMWSAVSEREVEFSEEYNKMYIDVAIKMGAITNKAEIISIRNEK